MLLVKKFIRRITAFSPKRVKKQLKNKHLAIYLRRYFFLFLAILAFAILQLVVIFNSQYREARYRYQQKYKEYYYWSNVVSQFPSIPDVLYNGAMSAFNIGRTDKAIEYLNKALEIDPLFKKAQDLKNEISK